MNEQVKTIVNKYWDDSYFEDFDKSERQRHFLNEFAKDTIRNCIFEMVHESTLQSNKEVQDFTVRVVERIKNKFGFE